MRRLRDFASINSFFSDQEIDELQAAIDARREARSEARAARQDDASPQDGHPARTGAAAPGTPEGGWRAS